MFLTTYRNLGYQQNLASHKLSTVVIKKQQWPDLKPHVQLVAAAVNAAMAGSYGEVEIP